jgi:CubicO group peptidase (beta-lactamase class C family)
VGSDEAQAPARRVVRVRALEQIDAWPAPHPRAAVVFPSGAVAARGDLERPAPWASVTKLVTALAVLVAAEEGIVDLDEPAGPPGATVRHLLTHASGLPFEDGAPIARPGERRIYSNAGYEALGALLAQRAEMPAGEYLAEAVLRPAGAERTRLLGSVASDLVGPLSDLAAFAHALFRPSFVAPETFAEATRVAFPGLGGVLPGIGRQEPNDWGLGFELRDRKSPHWTGARNSPATFGHFGRAGSFLWLDPEAQVALVCLTELEFGPWALEAWPALSDAVLDEVGA